ncbi:MAG TPA: response regulator [Puia sp.]|nr:response regulator [Puia sp.]
MSPVKRILIIDDDADHLLFCQLVFQRRGYEVFASPVVSDWDELLRILARFNADLIFLDHQLGTTPGAGLIKKLKADPDHSKIPVVLFSGNEDIVALAQEAGADGHLKKPFTIFRLMEITNRFISREP